MMTLDERQKLILTAALAADDAVALAAWNDWLASGPMETAPHAELRILPAAFARLSRIRPLPSLPQKLVGKARATFTRNNVLSAEVLDTLSAFAEAGIPVITLKGFAHALRFNSFARRTMGDIDIAVPEAHLLAAARLIEERRWQPCYGLSYEALVTRVALRRHSWNFLRGSGHLDLHWRIGNDGAVEEAIWRDAETRSFRGQNILIPSAAASLFYAMRHAQSGTDGDRMQLLADAPDWLSVTPPDALVKMLGLGGVEDAYGFLRKQLPALGTGLSLPDMPPARRVTARQGRRPQENSVLKHPRLYRLWNALGRPAVLERAAIRYLGPMSRPLKPLPEPQNTIDFRAAAALDAVGGPGWGWSEMDETGCWADGPDARLLLRLPMHADSLLMLVLSSLQGTSRYRKFRVFANGHPVARSGAEGQKIILLPIPARMLRGPWLELSLRPPGRVPSAQDIEDMRTIAVNRVIILNGDAVLQKLGGGIANRITRQILEGDMAKLEKLSRIRARMAESRERNNPSLPVGFDGISYVLNYIDLLEAEVDPYEHYLYNGKKEGRSW